MFTSFFRGRGGEESGGEGADESAQEQPVEAGAEESAPAEEEEVPDLNVSVEVERTAVPVDDDTTVVVEKANVEVEDVAVEVEQVTVAEEGEAGSMLDTAFGIGTSVGKTAYSVVGTTVNVGGKIVGGIVDTSIYLTNTAYTIALGAIDITSKSFILGFSHLSSSVTALAGLANAGGSATVEYVGETFESVFSSIIEITSLAGKTVDLTLVTLSGEANEEASISTEGVRLGAGLLPIIGDVQTYGDARRMYREAQLLEDEPAREEMMQEARRKCLVACTLVGIQAATLPISGPAQVGLNVAGTVIGAADTVKTVQKETKNRWYLPTIGVDLLTPHADKALQYEPIHDAMEWLLLVEYDKDKYLKDVDVDTESEQE